MNTRLQVEHPVTEAITGLDLVQWQLLVAMGHELPIKNQEDIPGPFGHAMEMRVYAEDTAAGFVPAPGLVHALKTPSIDCRVESAIIEGDEVSVYYDPMIAKLIVWGDNRIEAIHKADLALSQFNVGGVETNIDFMRRILRSKAFQFKPVTTKFIDENRDELLPAKELTPEQIATATLALSAIQDYVKSETIAKAFRLNTEKKHSFTFKDGEKSLNVAVTTNAEKSDFSVGAVGDCKLMKIEKIGNIFEIELKVGDRTELVTAALGPVDNYLTIFTRDGSYKVEVPTLGPLDRSSADASGEAGSGKIKSPMPGTLEKVFVSVGDSVKKGQQLGTLVAMKMEHVIRSPCDGVVEKIYQEVGKTVPKGSNLFSVK